MKVSFSATAPVSSASFAEWMNGAAQDGKSKNLTWKSCKFRTEDNGDFHYEETWG